MSSIKIRKEVTLEAEVVEKLKILAKKDERTLKNLKESSKITSIDDFYYL